MIKKNKSDLTEMEYLVTQEAGTEPPFQNEYWNHFEKGVYVDKMTLLLLLALSAATSAAFRRCL